MSAADDEPEPSPSGRISLLPAELWRHVETAAAVSNVAGVLKELVDNAVDAGARSIEVRLSDGGVESIEVADNGCGIAPGDFQLLGRRGATSKLRAAADLPAVATVGFRGQALHCLCALADRVIVCTRHGGEPVGARLVFDTGGRLVENAPCARNVGTSVTVRRIFAPLPVRRSALVRNGRAETPRTVRTVQQLALAYAGVRLSCVTADNNGKRSRLCATSGGGSVRPCVAELFGWPAARQLVDIAPAGPQCSPCVDDESRQLYALGDDELAAADHFTLSGLASVSAHGGGRTSADRQFVFVNSRPVRMPALLKVANEVYKRYNKDQYPALFIYIGMPLAHADHNASVDKQQPVVSHERALHAVARTTLGRVWAAAAALCPSVGATMDCSAADPSASARNGEEHVVNYTLHDDAAPKAARQRSLFDFAGATAASASHSHVSPAVDEPVSRQGGHPPPPASPAVERGGSAQPAAAKRRRVAAAAPLASVKRRRPVTVVAGVTLEAVAQSRRLVADGVEKRHVRGRGFTAAARPSLSLDALAEGELSKRMTKDDFAQMAVVGQFNAGFIIAQLADDVFIVDQHASDEKRRFERYCGSGNVVKWQMLIRPQRLELGAAALCALRHNPDVLLKNGFDVDFTQHHESVCTASLLAVPNVEGTLCDQDDLAELAHALVEAPGVLFRPSKVRKVFASKACRKAVMVGDTLTVGKMKQILCNLSPLDNPWSCPHGRPTVRHLVELGAH